MIYICVGTDLKKKNAFLKTLAKNREHIALTPLSTSIEGLMDYASHASLFGEMPLITLENILSNSSIDFSKDSLEILSKSKTLFVFYEDTYNATLEKKYKKYVEQVEKCISVAPKTKPVNRSFALADAFGKKNKIEAWVLYRQAIDAGTPPEALSGMLFWKIKSLVLSNSRTFTKDTLKRNSSELVSIYHKAHLGEGDLSIALEQFILKTLS